MDAVGSHTGGVSMFTRSMRQLSSARTNRTRARSPSHRQPVGFPLSTGGVCEFPTVNRWGRSNCHRQPAGCSGHHMPERSAASVALPILVSPHRRCSRRMV